MPHKTIVDSIASCDSSLGTRIARHLELFWDALLVKQGAVRGNGFMRFVTGEPHPLGNAAVIADGNNLQTTLDAIAPFKEASVASAVLFTTDVIDSVVEVVRAHGFERHSSLPGMAIDIDSVRLPRVLPPGYTCTRIGSGTGGQLWTDSLAEGFELPPTLARMLSPDAADVDMAADAPMQFFGILHNGQVVATSMLLLADGLAGIYCVATRPEKRCQGLGARITAEALQAAQRLGYRVGVLQATEEGQPVYRSLGFQTFGEIAMYLRLPN